MNDTNTGATPVTVTARGFRGGDGHSIWPGLLLSGAIAAFSLALQGIPGFPTLSPLIVAIIIGVAVRNSVGTPAAARAGVAFGLKRVLRVAVALLGLQLTLAQVAAVGGGGLAVIAATLAATFLFTLWIGRRLGVDRDLTGLIAAGTSICGASAVVAMNAVSEAHDEDVAYAVACVTVFGTLSMLLYPLLPGLLHLDPHAYGLWAGASIHEVAQVVAAAFQDGPAAGEFGTVAKLSRVMMLAPVVTAVGMFAARRGGRAVGGGGARAARPPVPWFVLGFVALVVLGSVLPVPAEPKAWVARLTTFLLCLALAGMGMETDIRKLRAKGPRPLLVAAAAWLFISAFSLALVVLWR